jgi:hypothetical protein
MISYLGAGQAQAQQVDQSESPSSLHNVFGQATRLRFSKIRNFFGVYFIQFMSSNQKMFPGEHKLAGVGIYFQVNGISISSN